MEHSEKRAPGSHKQWWVYFLEAGRGGPIKIGRAIDPYQRMVKMQSGNHSELRMIAIVSEYDFTEEDMHHRFRSARIRGEWFRPIAELKRFIANHGCDEWVRVRKARIRSVFKKVSKVSALAKHAVS